jgi:hypothetical protein
MTRDIIYKARTLGIIMVSAAFITGCGLFGGGGNQPTGDLTGVVDRPAGWVMTTPYGMVPIPAGTFSYGTSRRGCWTNSDQLQ